ncbi:uncharacterized protein LOC119675190 [Teleopsis dalmanni]|uniref:uncharacterized protein LOC119675190 n=1 Tax=Teleopsis dalmanni TaxID=139649 RepID=UPI0018CEC53F|nr:uncharacterized protein LOC119675190 [Teleopsis dalmanni]
MCQMRLSKCFFFITLYTVIVEPLWLVNCVSINYSGNKFSSGLFGRTNDFGKQSSNIGNSKSTNILSGADGTINSQERITSTKKGDSAGLNTTPGSGGEVLGSKSFPLSSQEPTCEQLRAMWIFSKRQSRAAEISNEIPTFRDPLAYNIWEPFYSSTANIGSFRVMPQYGDHSNSPVFGRVLNREPLYSQRFNELRQRHLTESGSSRPYNGETKPFSSSIGLRRPNFQYRYVGSNGSTHNSTSNQNSAAVQGSFQKLKELIWTERAKELTQQRRAEELAARAAVLKEIANGQNIQSSRLYPQTAELLLMDENRVPDPEKFKFAPDRKFNVPGNKMQTISSGHKNNKEMKIPNISSTRTFVNKNLGLTKPPTPTDNFGLRLGKAITFPALHERDILTNSDISRSSPLRTSHFRERNRSLINQGGDYGQFRRQYRFNPLYMANPTLKSKGLDTFGKNVHQQSNRYETTGQFYEDDDEKDDSDEFLYEKFKNNLNFDPYSKRLY